MRATILTVCLGLGVGGAALAAPEEKKPAPLYTNDDLERVSRFRDQTGVASRPGFDPSPPGPEPRPSRGEVYWRREAERVRQRIRTWEEQAARLRAEIDSPRPPVRGSRGVGAGRSTAVAQAHLRALERNIRQALVDLEERARRDGALPGWLR